MNNRFEQLASLGEGLNALGQHMQLSLEMSKRDRRKNLAIILYSHILSLFQSILRESNSNHWDEACTLLPDIIDSSFAAVAVVKNPQVTDYFFDDQDVQQIFRRNRYQTLPRDISGKIRYLSGEHFAQEAGMADYFTAIHRVLWDSVETARDDCWGYRTAPPGAVPERVMRLILLVPACESMFLATRMVADFFRIRELDREYYEYWQSYADLVCRN